MADFIVVAEFSELVGPVALQVIPETGGGQFDIARFVLKVTKRTDFGKEIFFFSLTSLFVRL